MRLGSGADFDGRGDFFFLLDRGLDTCCFLADEGSVKWKRAESISFSKSTSAVSVNRPAASTLQDRTAAVDNSTIAMSSSTTIVPRRSRFVMTKKSFITPH
jgi:hypothetical protein